MGRFMHNQVKEDLGAFEACEVYEAGKWRVF
jgi:hypothetical protein